MNCLNGWNSFWDSDDSTTNATLMLQEAIKELGGVYDPTDAPPELPAWVWKPKQYFDGASYFMAHLLIIVTNQGMDQYGLSIPHWNALIVQANPSGVRMSMINRHEFSHQFYCSHCSNGGCFMNPDWLSVDLAYQWCETCFDTINSNREKWGYPRFTLTISAIGTGTTHPLPGTYEHFEGTSVTVTAEEGYAFTFSGWILDGTTQFENPITVTMNSDHTLEAHFSFVGGGGGGCPVLSVFDGSNYVTEGLLDIHNPDGVDLVYNHTLITEPAWTTGAYQLRITEHPQTHSYIDQVKLYATLEDGTEIELPLICAWHSEDGNVLPQLSFSDEWKTDTLGADRNNGTSQSIDLRFSALPRNLSVVSFVFQIEGNNVCYKR